MPADESGDLVRACPECDMGGNVVARSGRQDWQVSDERYRCGQCGATFDEFVERERRSKCGHAADSLVAKLQDLDPDAVGGETA